MKNFRLKKEAVPFFLKKHATSIYSYETWQSLQVDMSALEEVEPAFLEYGIKTSSNESSLGGWSKEKGTDFCFTIHFPSMKYQEYDKFKKGGVTRELMNKIQQNINYFYQDFVNEEIE